MTKRETANSTSGPYVGIIGLGYVGLPLAQEFCRGGATVLGFDINSKMVALINKGRSLFLNERFRGNGRTCATT